MAHLPPIVGQILEQFLGGAVDGGEGGEAAVPLRDQTLEHALHANGACMK